MIHRSYSHTRTALVTWAVLSGCGGAVSQAMTDAALDQDGTTDGPTEATSRMLDGASEKTPPMRDATIDRGVPAEAAPEDGGASDAGVIDTGGEAETSCAVDAGPLDDAEVQLGLSIVKTHRCSTCHGGTLSGNYDGVLSPTLEGGRAYPPNLTPDPATGLGCWTNDEIENAFLNGIDNEGMRLCPPMPMFGHLTDGGALDAAQAHAVVEFLRSLPIFVNAVPSTPDCPMPEAGAPEEAGPPIEAGLDAGDGAAEDASDGAINAASDSGD